MSRAAYRKASAVGRSRAFPRPGSSSSSSTIPSEWRTTRTGWVLIGGLLPFVGTARRGSGSHTGPALKFQWPQVLFWSQMRALQKRIDATPRERYLTRCTVSTTRRAPAPVRPSAGGTMPIQFDVDPSVARLAEATAEFVREVVIPAERECGGSVHDAPHALRETLQKGAREAGVFAPHVPKRWGGHGLDLRGQAVVFEAAGYSLLGPLALN